MYRESPYNKTSFNRPSLPYIDGQFSAHGQSSGTVSLNYDASLSVSLHGTGGMSSHLVVGVAAHVEQLFNRLSFNRQYTNFLDLSFSGHGESSMAAKPTMDFTSIFRADGEGTMSLTLIVDILISLARLDGTGTLALEVIREKFIEAIMHGEGTFSINVSRYRVDEIILTGEFKPGDQLIIDARNLTVRLNGQNALHMLQGDFFELNVGKNVIRYSDDQTSRDIRIRVTHHDRYV